MNKLVFICCKLGTIALGPCYTLIVCQLQPLAVFPGLPQAIRLVPNHPRIKTLESRQWASEGYPVVRLWTGETGSGAGASLVGWCSIDFLLLYEFTVWYLIMLMSIPYDYGYLFMMIYSSINIDPCSFRFYIIFTLLCWSVFLNTYNLPYYRLARVSSTD